MGSGTRRKLAIGAGAFVLVAGGGVAIGATQLAPREQSKAVVEDAARELGVDPAKLSDALKQALENRVDEAVENGRLTEEQGARLKERIQADDYPLFGVPGLRGHGPRGHGFRGRGGPAFGHAMASIAAAADYLGMTDEALRESLRAGKSLADAAREKGKSVDGLVDVLVAEKTKRLDAAVQDGRLTKAQRDRIVASLRERTTALVNGERPAFGKRGFGGGRKGFGRRGFGFGGPPIAPDAPPPAEGGSSSGGFDELPPVA